MKRLISIVVPAYNESDCVDELARRLQSVFAELEKDYDFEAIIVENGSADDTLEKLLAIRKVDERFKVIQLARNFDMEGGMCAGLAYATGDAAVIMSADLQDPPELIPEFVRKWEEGYENVYQIVTRRTGNSLFRRAASAVFYSIINRVSDRPVPKNVSDFRLVDRRLYETFNGMPERNRVVRAMWGWIGFRSCGIKADRPPRHGGKSAFSTIRTAGFAVKAILSSSSTPLKAIPLFGLCLSLVSFVVLGGVVVRAVFYGVPFSGFGTILGFMLLLFGFLFLFLGMLAEYIGMIFEEVRRRPIFVVRQEYGTTAQRDDVRRVLIDLRHADGDDPILKGQIRTNRS